MSKKAKDGKKSIVRRRTRLLKQEDEEKMKEMGLEAILESISQINTRDGISLKMPIGIFKIRKPPSGKKIWSDIKYHPIGEKKQEGG